MSSSEKPVKYTKEKVNALRRVISDTIRVQLGGAAAIEYVDPAHFLFDAASRNNHVIFGRRGTGKTLLLHSIAKQIPKTYKAIYINCEDYKTHSFPNVLIEILDRLFDEIEKRNLSRALVPAAS